MLYKKMITVLLMLAILSATVFACAEKTETSEESVAGSRPSESAEETEVTEEEQRPTGKDLGDMYAIQELAFKKDDPAAALNCYVEDIFFKKD